MVPLKNKTLLFRSDIQEIVFTWRTQVLLSLRTSLTNFSLRLFKINYGEMSNFCNVPIAQYFLTIFTVPWCKAKYHRVLVVTCLIPFNFSGNSGFNTRMQMSECLGNATRTSVVKSPSFESLWCVNTARFVSVKKTLIKQLCIFKAEVCKAHGRAFLCRMARQCRAMSLQWDALIG